MTIEEIENAFFSLSLKNEIAPSRKDMVEHLGGSGDQILETLGTYAKNLEKAWSLNIDARAYLAKKIQEAPSELHVIASKVSFLPVWSGESKVVTKK